MSDGPADLRRTAALVGLLVLATLLATDLLVMDAVLARYAGDLNPLGRVLVGAGGAAAVKITLIAGLMAFVLRRRVTHLGLVCTVWAVAGVYMTIVVVNAYTLHAAGRTG
jgi:hypothetical protein